MKTPYFVITTLARFPRIVAFLVSRVTPNTRDSRCWLLWNVIDHTTDPDTLWDQLGYNAGYWYTR